MSIANPRIEVKEYDLYLLPREKGFRVPPVIGKRTEFCNEPLAAPFVAVGTAKDMYEMEIMGLEQ